MKGGRSTRVLKDVVKHTWRPSQPKTRWGWRARLLPQQRHLSQVKGKPTYFLKDIAPVTLLSSLFTCPISQKRTVLTNIKGTWSSPAPVQTKAGPPTAWSHTGSPWLQLALVCASQRPQGWACKPRGWCTGSPADLLSSLHWQQRQHTTLVSGAGKSAPSTSKCIKIEALFRKKKTVFFKLISHSDLSQCYRTTKLAYLPEKNQSTKSNSVIPPETYL